MVVPGDYSVLDSIFFIFGLLGKLLFVRGYFVLVSLVLKLIVN